MSFRRLFDRLSTKFGPRPFRLTGFSLFHHFQSFVEKLQLLYPQLLVVPQATEHNKIKSLVFPQDTFVESEYSFRLMPSFLYKSCQKAVKEKSLVTCVATAK